MKFIVTFMSMLIIGISMSLSAQNAPIASFGTITTTASTAVVPITAVNFTGIRSCDLILHYNSAVATPTAVTTGSGLGGSIDIYLGTPGEIRLGWYASSGVTLSNGSTIFNVTFNKASYGTSSLSFDVVNDDYDCQFYNSSLQALNDSPASTYYITGSLTFNPENESPVTTAPALTACSGANIDVPITVTGFNNIGAVSLTLNYDPAVLSYKSGTNTGGFPAIQIGNYSPGTLIVGGFTSIPDGYSLANGSVLLTLSFSYLGGTTALSWFDDGGSCEYAGRLGENVLNDTPQSSYYINGSVGPASLLTPTITASGPTSLCTGDNVNLISSVGASYLWSTGETTQIINVTTSGSYTVTVTDAGGCKATSEAMEVTVNPTVTIAAFSPATSTRSQGAGTVNYTTTASNNSAAIVYNLDAESLTAGNTINSSTGAVTYSAGWSGTTTIMASAEGCNGPATTTHVVTINALPTAYDVTGGGSFCSVAEGYLVGLSGSQIGVTYTLFMNDVAMDPPVEIAGTGNAIDFGNQPSGTFTVKGTNSNGTTDMTGSAIITEKPSPTLNGLMVTNPTCYGEQIDFSAWGLLPGVKNTFYYKATVGGVTFTGSQEVESNEDGVAIFSGTGYDPGSYNLEITSIVVGNCTTEFTDKTANFVVNSNLPASVSIAAVPSGAICAGTPVTFTATPTNGGPNPGISWFINGIFRGYSSGSLSYTSYTLANGDVITVEMTSTETCATGSPANSNEITMSVNSNLPASVGIAAVPSGAICAGTPVTFTATSVNEGTTPVYQWKVNGAEVGTNSPTYSYAPANGDLVTCVLTSSETCATDNPVTSNVINMLVNSLPLAPTAGVTPEFVIESGQVVFSATPSSGTIKWFDAATGGLEVSVLNPTISTTTTYYAEAISENGCVSSSRTAVTATVIPQGTNQLSYRFANPRIVNGSGSNSFEFDVQVKADVAGTYFYAGNINMDFNSSTLSPVESNWTATPVTPYSGEYNTSISISGSNLNIDLTVLGSGAEITTGYQTLVTVSAQITDENGVAGIDFNEANMNGHQFYKLPISPYYSAYNNPNEYDQADFKDTYVERVFCSEYHWTQIGDLDWEKSVNTSVWDGNAEIPGGSLTNASNLRIHNPATLTIPVDGKMTVTGDSENKTPKGLTIESDETGTGSLITATASGTGSTIAKRYVTTDAWHIVSSPLYGQSIADFLTTNSTIATSEDNVVRGLMDYNPTLNEWNEYFTSTTVGTLETAKGYCMRTNANSAVTFIGNLQAGNQSASGLVPEMWNCIGNPYTSAIGINTNSISASNFLDENADNFADSFGAIYVWNQPDASNGIWGMYTVISNASPAFEVQQGQAYLVNLNPGVSSINFNAGMQIHDPELTLKSTRNVWPTIKLITSVNTQKSSTIITFNNGMTKGLDRTYDAGLLKGNDDLVVYSRLVEDNGIPFSIQALPANDYNSMIIPICLDFKTGGEVVFSSELINLPSDCQVILEDRRNKTFTDLSKDVYTVAIDANSSIHDRFQLHTSYLTTGLDKETLTEKLSAYAIRNVEMVVRGDVSNQAVASVYDVMGRLVLTTKLDAGIRNSIKLPMIKTGIYMLYVKDNGNVQGFKVPVKE